MKTTKKEAQGVPKDEGTHEKILQFLQMLHLVLDTIPQRVFWKDLNHVYMGCNNRFAQDAGLSNAEDIVGKKDDDLPWGDRAEEYRKYDKQVILTKKPLVDYEQIVRNVAGKKLCVRAFKVPLRDKNGKIIGVLGSYEDITKHKEMEVELVLAEERKKSEAEIRKLSQALEHSPMSVIITDRRGYIEYVNPKFIQLSGYAGHELIGGKPNLLKSGYHEPKFYKEMWEHLKRGEEWSGTFCNKKKNGEYYWEAATISSLKDDRGKITHYIGVKEDITEKKLAEEALSDSEQKYRALFEGANDAIAMIEDGCVIDCNPHTLKMFGFKKKVEIIGRRPSDLSPPEQLDGRATEIVQAEILSKAERIGYCRFEWLHKRVTGEIFPVEVQLTMVNWGGRKIMQTIVRDITERKHAEMALEWQKREIEENYRHLKELEKLRDNLTHMIVHDMRSPLTSVNMAFELLKSSLPIEDKPAAKILQRGQKSTSELIEMATQLLDVSRLESGKMPLTKSSGDIVRITQSIADSMMPQCTHCHLELTPCAAIVAYFDVDIVRRVMINLISNAIKFAPKDTAVRVSLDVLNASVLVSVSDKGPGIPQEFHQKIFEKFGQAEKKDKKFGTGLGLTFCKLAIEAHGGKIGVESKVGEGSTFWFTLPMGV